MADYDLDEINFMKRGAEWYIPTKDSGCNLLFHGLEVNSTTIIAKVEWTDCDGNKDPPADVCPSKIILACDYIGLIFHPHTVASDKESTATTVNGLLANGKSFQLTGPGWGWSQRP
jgi:hypothetical protein